MFAFKINRGFDRQKISRKNPSNHKTLTKQSHYLTKIPDSNFANGDKLRTKVRRKSSGVPDQDFPFAAETRLWELLFP